MDLFNQNSDTTNKPLAEAMRPQSFSEFYGQKHLFGTHSVFKRMMDKGHLSNIILWGPPGTGKTTFAHLISKKFDHEFIKVNAVDTGAKKLREIGQKAHTDKRIQQIQSVLFIDEIHRLNKSQQDVLLPFTESGDLILVGATTENPSYEINSALLSRSQVLLFKALGPVDFKAVYKSFINKYKITEVHFLLEEALQQIIADANGDTRKFLTLLEQVFIVFKNKDESDPSWPMSVDTYLEFFKKPSMLYYDKAGCDHYDTTSAFIKSIRGSDPDAAIYYLARMIKGGEDPVFIARRLVILASEDVGNADPKALPLALAGLQAVKLVGLPEAGINLAQVTTYLAAAPKSNRSYLAYKKALSFVESTGNLEIPLALRSAQTQFVKKIGYGKDYKYSHDGKKGYVDQSFLPKQAEGEVFYEPSERGFEKNINEYLKWMKK